MLDKRLPGSTIEYVSFHKHEHGQCLVGCWLSAKMNKVPGALSVKSVIRRPRGARKTFFFFGKSQVAKDLLSTLFPFVVCVLKDTVYPIQSNGGISCNDLDGMPGHDGTTEWW